jgi:hypothetical protein
MFVRRERRRLVIWPVDLKWEDLFNEPSVVYSVLGALLGSKRVPILLVAGNIVPAREILGRFTHDQPRKRIVESVAIHSIDESGVAHAHAPSRAFGIIGNSRHALGSTGEDGAGPAEHNLLGGKNYRPKTRPACLIDSESRNILGETGAVCDLSRYIWTAAGLPRATPDRILYLIRAQTGAVQALNRYGRAHVRRGPGGERTAKAPDWSPHRTREVDVHIIDSLISYPFAASAAKPLLLGKENGTTQVDTKCRRREDEQWQPSWVDDSDGSMR